MQSTAVCMPYAIVVVLHKAIKQQSNYLIGGIFTFPMFIVSWAISSRRPSLPYSSSYGQLFRVPWCPLTRPSTVFVTASRILQASKTTPFQSYIACAPFSKRILVQKPFIEAKDISFHIHKCSSQKIRFDTEAPGSWKRPNERDS